MGLRYTKDPKTMKLKLENEFDDIKTGRISITPGSLTSSFDPMDMYKDDYYRILRMTHNVLKSGEVTLTPVTVARERRFFVHPEDPNKTARWVKDPHLVDYVMCHLRGYRKYLLGEKNMPIYVRGRDVIIASTMASIPDIIKMMKEQVEGAIT